jgi:peptidoglycan/xylan/chitin deacetylase (PgdA/CDA1 family)
LNQIRIAAALAAGLACAGPALADDCLNPDALGTARTLAVDPAVFARVGGMQYAATLPLAKKEVVLTFDDGPMPPMNTKVLETLANECVRATFFLIGRNAKTYQPIVRRIAAEGHTVANHSENHFLTAQHGPNGVREFDKGFETISAALALAGHLPAPFFRFPGLLNTQLVEGHAKAKGVSVMSADLLADDWTGINAGQVLQRALLRLDQKASGILLLHDVQPATALALPNLLRELKKRGYRVVHMIPAPGAGAPPLPPAPQPLVAEKLPPAPAPVAAKVHKVAARHAAPKPAETEPAPVEFRMMSRWRKYFEERKGAATAAASYPGNDRGGL